MKWTCVGWAVLNKELDAWFADADCAFQRHRLDQNTASLRRLSLDPKHDHAPLHLHARVSTGLARVISSNGNSMEQRRIIDQRCKHPVARDQGRDMSPVVLMPVGGAFRVDR